MRRKRFNSWVCGAVGLAVCVAGGPIAWGQARDADTPRQQVDRGFERNSPGVGEPLPDVAAYDADGQPLRLASLKGSHTVLVFGCLT